MPQSFISTSGSRLESESLLRRTTEEGFIAVRAVPAWQMFEDLGFFQSLSLKLTARVFQNKTGTFVYALAV